MPKAERRVQGASQYAEGCWEFPYLKSFLVVGFLVIGFLASWCLVSWFLVFFVSWFLDFVLSWIGGSRFHCFRFLGFVVSGCLIYWFRGCLVSWFQGFKKSFNSFIKYAGPHYQTSISCFLIDIELAFKIAIFFIKRIVDMFSARLFENCQHFGFPTF